MATLGGLAAAYVDARRSRGEYAARTAQSVYSVLVSLAEYVGYGLEPSKLTTAKIDQWLRRRHIGDATKRRNLSHVRLWTRWMVAHGYLRKDPAANIRGPHEPRRLPRNFKAAWVAAVLAECVEVRDELIVLLMVQEGLRCVEVSRLQVGDIDFTSGMLHIVGKGGHEREVPITAEARAAIDRYLREFPTSSGPLIGSYVDRSRPISAGYISTRVSRLCAAAGVHGSPHDGRTAHGLRHTAATDVVEHGGDVRDVQTMLGHASLATSSIYIAHSKAMRLREVMDGRWYGLRRGVPRGVELGKYRDDRAHPACDDAGLGPEPERPVGDVDGVRPVVHRPAAEA